MKTVKVRKKVKIFLESVFKTVFYVKRAPLNSYVGSLTIPLAHSETAENSVILLAFVTRNKSNKYTSGIKGLHDRPVYEVKLPLLQAV